MNATASQSKANYITLKTEPGFGLRAYREAVLDELPGAAFALVTLAYIILSLIKL